MLRAPTRPLIPILLPTLLAACGEIRAPGAADAGGPRTDAIVNGTRSPQNITLTAGQMLAIGYLADPYGNEFCTGTVVEPRKVITARHCIENESPSGVRFGIGTYPSNPEALLQLDAIVTPPSGIDFAVLILASDATTAVPGLEPLAMNRTALSSSWIGRWVDASGFGDTYSSARGRFFASVQIYTYDSETVSVDGHGEQGICYGDSGGPILWQSAAGPVVVGTEQWGDSSCVDRDHLTRVDLLAGWVDGLAVGGGGSSDPCGGIDYLGTCDGNTAVWCDNGTLAEHDCGTNGTFCGWVSSQYGYYCLPAACGSTDSLGECNGTTTRWCNPDSGQLVTYNCANDGETCGWVDDTTGADCVPVGASGGGTSCEQDPSLPECGGGGTAPTGGPVPYDGKAAVTQGGCAATPTTGLAGVPMVCALLLRRRRRRTRG